jgi:hypothetical protein
VSSYIREKLEQKQKIDEDIKAADSLLQSKNMSIQATKWETQRTWSIYTGYCWMFYQMLKSHRDAIMALTNLQSHGIPEEKILLLNSFLGNNGYKDMISKSLIE